MILFRGEDIITCPNENGSDLHARAAVFRQSGFWEEVVPGMTDLTVKFDPLKMSRSQAEQRFVELWNTQLTASGAGADVKILTADLDRAPDCNLIANALQVAQKLLPNWLSSRTYRVAMMGFQPGFAYLEDIDGSGLPVLSRLSSPRQRVMAGSIGFLGKRACIYALDGPGGWPIIGHVREALFRREESQPFLLQPGQVVQFQIGQ